MLFSYGGDIRRSVVKVTCISATADINHDKSVPPATAGLRLILVNLVLKYLYSDG